MWTEKEITDFINNHPIDTGGALATHTINITHKEDGDAWVQAEIPYWSQNEWVVLTVLKFLLETEQQILPYMWRLSIKG